MRDLDEWKGRELTVRVLKMNRKRGNIVVSRRSILDELVASQRQSLLDNMAEGQIVKGVVKNVTGYGAALSWTLGGIDGLLHITDMIWGRVESPLDAVSPGEEVEVKILKYDKEKGRVSLGRKQLLPDPWASVVERYSKGTKLSGKIMGLTDYGAFVELEPGIEGLVHVSEMSWSKRKQHPSKLVKQGDMVDVIVLGVDSERAAHFSWDEAGAVRSVDGARGKNILLARWLMAQSVILPNSASSWKSRKDSTG